MTIYTLGCCSVHSGLLVAWLGSWNKGDSARPLGKNQLSIEQGSFPRERLSRGGGARYAAVLNSVGSHWQSSKSASSRSWSSSSCSAFAFVLLLVHFVLSIASFLVVQQVSYTMEREDLDSTGAGHSLDQRRSQFF